MQANSTQWGFDTFVPYQNILFKEGYLLNFLAKMKLTAITDIFCRLQSIGVKKKIR